MEFDVSGLNRGRNYYYKNLKDGHDDLIEYLTSRRFDELPDEIKDSGYVFISINPWPLIYGGGNPRIGVDGSLNNCQASRGVCKPV